MSGYNYAEVEKKRYTQVL